MEGWIDDGDTEGDRTGRIKANERGMLGIEGGEMKGRK